MEILFASLTAVLLTLTVDAKLKKVNKKKD